MNDEEWKSCEKYFQVVLNVQTDIMIIIDHSEENLTFLSCQFKICFAKKIVKKIRTNLFL